jgi:hypothetical protein
VRLLPILLAFAVGTAWAQDKAPEKKKAQKMEKKKAVVAHKKATPEQIRRFNDLEKKQQK